MSLSVPARSSTMSILKIHAREIFDSRGNPTVEVDLYTKKGTVLLDIGAKICAIIYVKIITG